jgi:pimeloyl-ACP methyl ester carboxylesterase
MPIPIDDLWVTVPDGLRLHCYVAGPRDAARLPVICLPGLARTGEDFRELMEVLASGSSPRRVIALESRGRGLSERDKNPANYNVLTELGDLLAVLDATGIARAVFVGTSRGGILTMLMAAARPRSIAGAVLNDIGPVIEMAGLLRIKGYVGKLPKPSSWEEAANILRATMAGQFPSLPDETWAMLARRNWHETPEGIEPRCDPNLSATLKTIDPSEPAPVLWPQFDALSPAPIMVMRGELTDLLSRETVATMRAKRPDLQVMEIAGQGHAPLLIEAETIGPIVKFINACDGCAIN